MSDRDRTSRLLVGLGSIGTALACVPQVPASVVVDETRPPAQRQRPAPESEGPKPSGPDRTPPTVTGAELVGSTSVRIHFSEPIVAPDDFDPSDFRISHLRVYFQRQGALYNAYYYDAAYYHHDGRAPGSVVMSHARFGEDTIDIAFAPELSPARCRAVEYAEHYDPPGVQSDEGLFLHYAAGQIPIRDNDGNALANFGAEWVLRGRQQPPETRLEVMDDAAKRVWTTSVRVACGPPIPPGPR